MIKKIELENFKSHRHTSIELGNLTILCGQNGIGKSSILQSLLLLRQTHQKNRLGMGLSLNKPLVSIGKGIDLLYQKSVSDILNINLNIDYQSFASSFDTQKSLESDFIPFAQSTNEFRNFVAHGMPLPSSLFTNDFQYISANRGVEYDFDDFAVEHQRQISIENGKAELTAHFLFKYQDEIVNKSCLHPSTEAREEHLLKQCEYWEREISEGINIHPEKKGDGYEIRYSFEHAQGDSNKFSTNNVGFGISYSLPIIVAILSAKNDALILVENPEAHLHPYGQAKLAELMCVAAQAGIQIIVETHSDHIVNGILVQCKRFENEGNGIDKSNVSIYQFEREQDDLACKTNKVEIKAGGKITSAPRGFFDQIGKDLRYLMKPNK